MSPRKRGMIVVGSIMGVICVFWLTPIYFMVINAFKTFKEVTIHTASFPSELYLENFKVLWQKADYPVLLRNSIIVTVGSLAGIILIGSMAGYKMARSKSNWAPMLLIYFIMTMIIPFQSVMIPLVKLMKDLNLIDSLFGLILVYVALLSPMAIFLYQAAAKSIPISIDESAEIDGAGSLRTFFQIIFPLMSPITATVVVLDTLFIWNDFLLPLITLQSPQNKTLSVGTYAVFVGQYSNKMNLGLAAVLLASLPMIVVYLAAQKYVIKGITGGATKG